MSPYLAPIDKPKGLRLKLLYRFLGRQFGTAPGWLTVWSARLPLAYTSWMGKVYTLNKKLELSPDTMRLIRARVESINMCTWCMDAGRWYVINKEPHLLPKLDALHDYQTSPLFSDEERAALDFASELTAQKRVNPETFESLARHYSERQICEIVWVVSTTFLMNINNLGLGVGSDGLCEINPGPRSQGARRGSAAGRGEWW